MFKKRSGGTKPLVNGFLVWAEVLAENEKYWLKLLVDKFFAWDEPNLQNSC